jgi:TPR repeat protein
MEIRPFLVTVGTSLCGLILLVVNVRGDVDPAMVGTWETSGVNANGPWKLIWEIRPDSSYFLSGAVSDSGIIGSGDGRWHTQSNVTNQTADGTYSMTDANHMLGAGSSGSGTWTRVAAKSEAGKASAAPSFSNPFESVFTQAIAADLSKQLADDYDKALLQKDSLSRDRLEKNAQDGVSEAQVRFAMLLQKEGDSAGAVNWYRKAAQKGNVDGMRGLGSCYRDGKGVEEDSTEAMKWYREASDKGDGDADSNIGGLYHNGRGVPRDDATAVNWFRKGAGKGSIYAMSDLAACYWTGTGVEKSAREAIKWWKLSADKGDEEAKEYLKTALEQFDESGQPRTRK